MTRFKYTLIVVVLLLIFRSAIFAQLTTTGPVPPPGIDRGLRPPSRAQHIIFGVPAYIWHHGCAPTALGMVIGYWDLHGCSKLVAGSAATQTSEVNAMMAEDHNHTVCDDSFSDHFHDYSCPMDSSTPGIIPDKSELGGAHISNCVADFMRTSWSSEGLRYGWSWTSYLPTTFIDYVNLIDPTYDPVSELHEFIDFSFDDFMAEIDSGRPVVLVVDIDGDGVTDHAVTGIGYDNTNNEYGVHDTWDNSTHWYSWREMNSGNEWGIYSITTFNTAIHPNLVPSTSSITVILLILILLSIGYVTTLYFQKLPNNQ